MKELRRFANVPAIVAAIVGYGNYLGAASTGHQAPLTKPKRKQEPADKLIRLAFPLQ